MPRPTSIFLRLAQKIAKAVPKFQLLNGGNIRLVTEDITIYLNSKPIYLRLEVAQKLSRPSNELLGFAPDDVDVSVKVFRFATATRLCGYIYPSLAEALPEVRTSDPSDWNFYKVEVRALKYVTAFNLDLLKEASFRRIQAIRQYTQEYLPPSDQSY